MRDSGADSLGEVSAWRGAKPIFKGDCSAEIVCGEAVGFNCSGNCGRAGVAAAAASLISLGVLGFGTNEFSGGLGGSP